MAYLRTKWINGHPYLYLQESYRENGQVKTRTVQYIGRGYGVGGGASGGARPGTTDSRAAVDARLDQLHYLADFPQEASLLRGYLYRYDAPLRVATEAECVVADITMSDSLHEYLLANHSKANGEYILLPNSSPFSWMHAVGHLLQDTDSVVSERLAQELENFVTTARNLLAEAFQGSLDKAEEFTAHFGDYVDIRQEFSINETDDAVNDVLLAKNDIATYLQQTKEGELDVNAFIQRFKAWVVPNFHFNTREVFARGSAALTVDAKYAARCFGKEGKKLLTVMYPVIHFAFEGFQWAVTGRKPRRPRAKRKTRRRTSLGRPSVRERRPREHKVIFYVGDVQVDEKAQQVLDRAENNNGHNALGTILYRHSTLYYYGSQQAREGHYKASVAKKLPINSTFLLDDNSAVWVSTFEGVTSVTLQNDAKSFWRKPQIF
ncbi:MAG: hypothetical protein KDE50_00850 [Caldilineaceae bacterium]|nr:hypothetical protein [Caldilineaceae bacterium]MCB0138434.1 hypothetical protein [Caldilineaceae bacterium]